MIKQLFRSEAAVSTCSIGILLFITIIIVLQSKTVNMSENQIQDKSAIDLTTENTAQETFQEIGFFGEVKKDKWNEFVGAVRNNIANSRKEQHNISFSLYQPKDGNLQPIWFERFDNKAAHNFHKEQNYFKDAITVIQQSLAAEAKSITLKILDEIPVSIPKISPRTGTSHFVIMLLEIEPHHRETYIGAMTRIISSSRKARGNLEFNLYSYAEDPNKFVLIEGWRSQADYAAQLEKAHIKKWTADLEGLLASNPKNARYIVRDISQ